MAPAATTPRLPFPPGLMSATRRGFTLIELLVVVIIISIIATIAVNRFTKSKQRAYVAAMTTQLRTLIPAEELYRSDSASYTNDVAKLQMVRESPQVHLTITQADAQTWSATAWHDAGSQVCSASGGVGSPTGAIGQIDCP